MSGLRQVHKETIPEEDLEALIEDKDEPPKRPASPAKSGTHNPVFLGKVILQKVVALVQSDEEDISSPGGIITLLRDIVLGIIMGVLTISILVFLDHKDIVHFQSAHNFRNAAFNLMNDPETIATLEESTNFKFMTMEEYEAKRKEIDGAAEKIASHQEVLEKRTAEAEAKKKEVEPMREEYAKLVGNPLLELDKWCGHCVWGAGAGTCDKRVQYLQEKYNTRPLAAKISAMSRPGCRGG